MAHNISYISSSNCLFLDTNLQPLPYISVANIVACVVNAIFAFIAASSNAIVLISVWKSPSLHTAQNTLLCSVALSDFLVGAVLQPLDVVQRIMEEKQNIEIYCSIRLAKNSLAWIISSVSFFILTSISLERLVALLRPLQHDRLVTHRRILRLVFSFWVVCITIYMPRFFGLSNTTFLFIASILVFANLTVIAVSYFKIFQVIKFHQRRIDHEANLRSRFHGPKADGDMKRYKTFTVTAAYIVVLVVMFYVPFFCYLVAYAILGFTGPVKLTYICIETLSFVNSSVNPFVYSYRLRNIRQAILRTLNLAKPMSPGRNSFSRRCEERDTHSRHVPS